jgi:hypothetical protein
MMGDSTEKGYKSAAKSGEKRELREEENRYKERSKYDHESK